MQQDGAALMAQKGAPSSLQHRLFIEQCVNLHYGELQVGEIKSGAEKQPVRRNMSVSQYLSLT